MTYRYDDNVARLLDQIDKMIEDEKPAKNKDEADLGPSSPLLTEMTFTSETSITKPQY